MLSAYKYVVEMFQLLCLLKTMHKTARNSKNGAENSVQEERVMTAHQHVVLNMISSGTYNK